MQISYSAVVLEEASSKKLEEWYYNYSSTTRNVFKTYCHHMTICMGPLPKELRSIIGLMVVMRTLKIGANDKVHAVAVRDYMKLSSNPIPHVTMLVHPVLGKPVMSNNISNWATIPDKDQLMLVGHVREVSQFAATEK